MKKNNILQNVTLHAKELIRFFPEIPIEKANKIDIEIKKRILVYQSSKINDDIAEFIREEAIKDYIYSKNKDKIKKKSNKLAAIYLENNRQWMMQENWFCILAYIITIVTMICRILEINTNINDNISIIMYFISLVIWIGIVKSKPLMGKKAELFLDVFNQNMPIMIIISSMAFYIAVCVCPCKIVWILIILLFVCLSMRNVIHWYKMELDACKF